MAHLLEQGATSWKEKRLSSAKTLVGGFDPRVRLVITMLFAIVVVVSSTFPALGLALLIALATALLARLDLHRTLRRVIAMDLFMVFLLLMLPFTTPGEPLFQLAGFTASKAGTLRAIEILLKANAVILAVLALIGTLEATTLGHALARLGFPEKLVHLLLFTVRYLEVISQEYQCMRRAMKARAFIPRSDRHTWRALGYLIGMLLVRSLERSERIFAAMKCRGYHGRLYLLDDMALRRADHLFLGASLLALGAVAFLNLV